MANQKYTLDLMFDVDQVTKALHYHFNGPKGSPFHGQGRLAGTFNFDVGDEVHVRVIATAAKKDLDKVQFAITDLTLASIPTLQPEKYYLSLFDRHRACVQVRDWGIPKRAKKENNTLITIKALHPLRVYAPNGQWELSGYLSVLIERPDKHGKLKKFSRLFYFDPESSSGTGGDIED